MLVLVVGVRVPIRARESVREPRGPSCYARPCPDRYRGRGATSGHVNVRSVARTGRVCGEVTCCVAVNAGSSLLLLLLL